MTPFRLVLIAAMLAAAAVLAALSPAPLTTLACAAIAAVAVALLVPRRRAAPPAPIVAETEQAVDPGALVDALDDPALLTEERVVVHANAAARALLGPHIVGEEVRVAIRHPEAARIADTDDRMRGVMLDGLGRSDSRWEMAATTIGDGHRLVHLVDRSATHAAEAMRVDFVANASHELRTPLATLMGFIETLADPAGPRDDATRARFLDIMGREARRMAQLVEDLISLSRIEADRHRLPETPLPLAPIITVAAESIRVAAGEAAGTFALDLDPAARIAGDEGQVGQLLHNVMGNALKYRRPGTIVRVTLDRPSADRVRLSVADEGEGIAPEHLPRLTERFYRVDAGRSRQVGGTGLGLAIVKHIVERHRGRLEIRSRQGVGTTVSVDLPACHQSVTERS